MSDGLPEELHEIAVQMVSLPILLSRAADEIESLRSRIKLTENILDKLSDEEPGLMSERVNLLLDWWAVAKETQDWQMECPTAESEEEEGE